MAIDNKITPQSTDDSQTPLSEEEIMGLRNLEILGLLNGEKDIGSSNSPNAPIPNNQIVNPYMNAELYAQNQPQEATATDAISPRVTEPLPVPGVGARLASAFSGVPILGLLANKPMEDVAIKRATMDKADTNNLKFLDDLIKDNPRQAGLLVKSPMFRDALVRQHKASDEDIMNMSKILSDPKLSPKEQTAILASSGMVNEAGSIVPRPTGVEREIQSEKEDFDKYSKAAKEHNKDWDDFDTLMGWYGTKSKKAGATMKGFEMKIPAGSTEALVLNKDTSEIQRIPINKLTKYVLYPMNDKDGNFAGILWTDPYDTSRHGVMTPETLFPGWSPERLAEIAKDRRSFMQKLRDILNMQSPGIGDQLQDLEVNTEDVTESGAEVTVPSPKEIPKGATFTGPAKNQLTPAEQEAAGVL